VLAGSLSPVGSHGGLLSLRVVEKAGMHFDRGATYYDIPNLSKYIAEREWWRPPAR
jgi:hypothetical protein